ncbi:MAG: hypothetical protein KDA60_20460 [Planctomycetales bacterium]|nr:hypothetical protein [Planctomycetales bacterium]
MARSSAHADLAQLCVKLHSCCGREDACRKRKGELCSKLGTLERSCVNDQDRSGYPNCVTWYAKVPRLNEYRGYYVGGGATLGGECRRADDEGTWGWDYTGLRFKRLVAAYWWHESRQRTNRDGSYATDGPKVLSQ